MARPYLRTDVIGRHLVGLLLIGISTSWAPRIAADQLEPKGAEEGEAARADASSPSWFQHVVREAIDSVVLISVEGRNGRRTSLGSGFVVSNDGLIATNLHVIGEARPINVQFRDGRQFPVTEIHATDRTLDLAIVRIAATDLKALNLVADNPPTRQGEPIVALGNPMGMRQSAVSGIISGQREIEGRTMLQIAVPIEQGNSGGPVLDQRGRVLGVVTLKSALTRNLGFATRSQALRSLLDSPNPIEMSRWKTIGALRVDDWTVVFDARWQQRSGQIVVSEAGNSFGGRSLCLWRGELPERPFDVGAFVRLENDDGAAGLVFHADGHDEHYGFYPSAGRLRLTRFDGPTVYSWQILEEIDSPHYRPDRWNHLKIRIAKNEVECFVNDQMVIQRRLPDTDHHQVGLAKFRDTRARFRQFTVQPRIEASQLAESRLAPIRRLLNSGPAAEIGGNGILDALADDVPATRQLIQQRLEQLQLRSQELERLDTDVRVRAICNELDELFARPEKEIRLAHGALLVSKLDNPDLDVGAYMQRLKQMSDEVHALLPDDPISADRLAALNRYLFRENGYHGSRTNYYHAANSYLDSVIDDREGLPITLSIIYLDLAEQLGLTMEGIGLPGHFVVRHAPDDADGQLIDVFDKAKSLSVDDARRLLQETNGVRLDRRHLEAVSKRQILLRVLRNLQGIAQRQQQPEALRRYLEAMVTLAPDEPAYRGMRAVVRFQTGRRRSAIEDLDWFLVNKPDGIDLAEIRRLRARFNRDPATSFHRDPEEIGEER